MASKASLTRRSRLYKAKSSLFLCLARFADAAPDRTEAAARSRGGRARRCAAPAARPRGGGSGRILGVPPRGRRAQEVRHRADLYARCGGVEREGGAEAAQGRP